MESNNNQNIITQLFVGFQIYIQKDTPAALQNCFLFTTHKVSGYQSFLSEQTLAIISADEKILCMEISFFVHSTCWQVLIKMLFQTHMNGIEQEKGVLENIN